jgi:hypothetical protein
VGLDERVDVRKLRATKRRLAQLVQELQGLQMSDPNCLHCAICELMNREWNHHHGPLVGLERIGHAFAVHYLQSARASRIRDPRELGPFDRALALIEAAADMIDDACSRGGEDRMKAVATARSMFDQAFGQIERGEYKPGATPEQPGPVH